MKNKKKGLLNKLFGFDTMKRGVTLTSDMVKDIKPNKKALIKETFNEALRRRNITKSEENTKILDIYKNHKIQYLIFTGGMLFMLYNAIAKIISLTGELTDNLAIISFSTLTFTLFSISLTFSFRCFQMRIKRLGMLNIWFKTPKEWFPRKIRENDLKIIDDFQEKTKEHEKLSPENYLELLDNFKKNNK